MRLRTTTTIRPSCRWPGSGRSTGSPGSWAAWTCSPAGRPSRSSFDPTGAGASRAPRSTSPCVSGLSLGAALVRPFRARPLRRSHAARHHAVARRRPRLEFKLDPTPEWDERRMQEIAATGRVRALDFKAFYEGLAGGRTPGPGAVPARRPRLPRMLCWRTPPCRGPTRVRFAGSEARFSFDAPIHSWADVKAVLRSCPRTAFRFFASFFSTSSLRGSGRCARCSTASTKAQAAGMTLYGGGQFELGVGREQIQAVASLFYADGPNDVAPRDYHGEARPAGAPRSPLTPGEFAGPRFPLRVQGL